LQILRTIFRRHSAVLVRAARACERSTQGPFSGFPRVFAKMATSARLATFGCQGASLTNQRRSNERCSRSTDYRCAKAQYHRSRQEFARFSNSAVVRQRAWNNPATFGISWEVVLDRANLPPLRRKHCRSSKALAQSPPSTEAVHAGGVSHATDSLTSTPPASA